MELYHLYQILQRSNEWINPKELKYNRKKIYKMTQWEFSSLIGVRYQTYKSWEIGRYTPSSPARALLHMAINHKNTFLKNREQMLKNIGAIYL